jgi:hypothetical protein
MPPPVGRFPAPSLRTRRKKPLLLIALDEFRPASLRFGLLASRARGDISALH